MTDSSALTTTSNNSVYSSIQSFESAQRMAASLADCGLVPPSFQGQKGLPDCILAIEIANRMGMSPFQVMQNLNVIHGRPSWSSKFIIALIKGCGRFEGFDYDETADSCQCYALEKASGNRVTGIKITLDMAKKEGWTRNAKWSTMPQTMLRWRAASSFGSFHIPDLILGIQSVEENEVIEAEVSVASEPPESKLEQINSTFMSKTEVQPVPEVTINDKDDFFD